MFRQIKVPFDELMDVIEEYIEDLGYVKENEFLLYADLGFPVDSEGNTEINLEIQDLLEYQPNEIVEANTNNIVQLNKGNI